MSFLNLSQSKTTNISILTKGCNIIRYCELIALSEITHLFRNWHRRLQSIGAMHPAIIATTSHVAAQMKAKELAVEVE